ncbi:DUF3152 domain-containing protein [Gephyromycinifex aptenodytis]|uniref:DUF3152 domain-containing protein n=1 Tax=Gephyromycinifex aptenodytis TaxID=2716227 RepID=UPI001D01CD09|nr:DUF3152 domain-containing protein [Gephyromycinifex aptenodytis]
MRVTHMRWAVPLVAMGLLAGCGSTQPEPNAQDADSGQPASVTNSASASTPAANSSPATSGTKSATAASTAGSNTTPPSPTPKAAVPDAGTGRTSPVNIPGADSDRTGRVVRYTIEIEGGLEEAAGDFPAQAHRILTDKRGWETKDGVHFVAVSPEQRAKGEQADIRIMFASPTHVDRMCAPMRTNGRLSCHKNGKVMINAWRWVNGAETYGNDLDNYRIYLVSHEVGHSLGHSHAGCPGNGRPAPVMLQQTLRLSGCRPSPWPVTGS